MLNLIFILGLVGADSNDGARSLSGAGSADVIGTPIEGSKMLYSVNPVSGPSVTSFLIKNIVMLEKTMDGVVDADEKEIKKRDPKLRKIISSVLDLDALGQAALITYTDSIAKTASGKKQLERYKSLFGDLVEENYLEKIRTYIGGKYRITFTGEVAGKRGTIAQARIKKKDADLIVEFLGLQLNGVWRIVDTRLDDTSLEETYRGSFNRIIKKNGGAQKGFPELLKVMEKRLTELKSGKATKL